MNIDKGYRDLSLKEQRIFLEDRLKEVDKKLEEKNRPKRKGNINWEYLIKLCEAIIDDYDKKGYSKDAKYWVYERAMKTIYGENVFEWLNEKGAQYE